MYKWYLIDIVKLNNIFFFDKSVAKCCKISLAKKIRPCPKIQNILNQASKIKIDNFLAFLHVLVITENYQIKKIYFWSIYLSDLGGALNLWMSVCPSVSLSHRIVQFWLQTSIFQHLIIWFRWNWAHLSTLGCGLWY